jgi:hypothetical protein
MAYRPGWLRIAGDPGTVSVALYGPHRAYLGYLNLTPRQGSEALSNWTRFRIGHNVEEGDRNVEPRSVGTGLRFAVGRGSCVRDLYTGTTGVRYEEFACLVAARRGAAVIVGASPPRAWARISPLLEAAISTLRAGQR